MNISLPTKLEIQDAKGNMTTATLEPCYPGYGVTLGNSLRRVLLSSIEGSAITSIKVSGAQHEFSTLPNVKEDLIELVLNIKKIRLKSFSDEPVILKLSVKGEKKVTAGDIEKNAQVEVINSETEIVTLTSKDASLEMELVVEKGRGYVTVEDRSKEKVDIGTILVDSLYSPLVRVGFEIENVRVGDRTDYERLVLKIETDGSITPQEALNQASQILVDHFQFVLENSSAGQTKKAKKAGKEEKAEAEVADAEEEKKAPAEEAEEEKPKKKRGRPKKTDK